MTKENEETPIFIIDSSALIEILKDDKHDMIHSINKLKESGKPFKAITTISSFLNALSKSTVDTKIGRLLMVMDFLEIGFMNERGFAVFQHKNDKLVTHDIIMLAKALSKASEIETKEDLKNG